MPQLVAEFMRFTAPDPVALSNAISEMRGKLAAAVHGNSVTEIVEAAANLGSMLTTARSEVEARQVLEAHGAYAESDAEKEPAGWFWNAYATALQYCGERTLAEKYFIKAIELAQSHGWRRLEALALHHWGRSLAEQERFGEAEARISEALAIRVELNEPRQESSRRALVELSAWQSQHARPNGQSAA